MTTNAVEKWVWLLIDGGLVLGSLGGFMQSDGRLMGTVALTVAGLMVAAGVLLVYIRSRMKA